MRKKTALVAVIAIAGLAFYINARLRQGGEVAEPHQTRSLTPKEIHEGLRSDDVNARLAAVEQLDRLPEETRKQALLEALVADASPTRLTAVVALEKRFPTDPDVVGALLETARNDLDTDVCEAAIRTLAASGDPRVLELALETVSSSETALSVRLQAAETLDRLTGRRTAGGLSGKLEEAEFAADDLAVAWDEWWREHGAKLTWDAETETFVEKE
jgi:HEAT repeat protein